MTLIPELPILKSNKKRIPYMKTTENTYIKNAKVWSKERTFNERTLALQEMMKIAEKHFPETVSLIVMELENERNNIRSENMKRKRMSIIGR